MKEKALFLWSLFVHLVTYKQRKKAERVARIQAEYQARTAEWAKQDLEFSVRLRPGAIIPTCDLTAEAKLKEKDRIAGWNSYRFNLAQRISEQVSEGK